MGPVPDWGGVTRRVPTIVTRTDLTVHSGSRRTDLLHPGRTAHTGGDLVAWLPEERVLFTGDLLFAGLTPLTFAGSVDGALGVLDLAAEGRGQGLTPLGLARQPDLGAFGAFGDWGDAERVVLNLHRVYADANGRPMDLAAAVMDAIDWSGGPMTTHVCCTG